MLKWILITIALIFVGGCVAVVGGLYWGLSSANATPQFYKDVGPVTLSDEERAEKLQEVREIAVSVLPTLRLDETLEADSEESAGEETGADESDAVDSNDSASGAEASKGAAANATADSAPSASAPDPRSPTDGGDSEAETQDASDYVSRTLRFDEQMLNTYASALMSEYVPASAPFSDPRIKLGDGTARIGFQLDSPQFNGIASLDVEPIVESPRSIAVVFRRIALGNLSIPLSQAMSTIEIDDSELPEGVSIPQNAKPPRIVFSWDHIEEPITEVSDLNVSEEAINLMIDVPNVSHDTQ